MQHLETKHISPQCRVAFSNKFKKQAMCRNSLEGHSSFSLLLALALQLAAALALLAPKSVAIREPEASNTSESEDDQPDDNMLGKDDLGLQLAMFADGSTVSASMRALRMLPALPCREHRRR